MHPHFRSREFLIGQLADALACLYPACLEVNLTERARLTGDLALAYLEFGDPAYRRAAADGVARLAASDHCGEDGARLLSASARATMAGVPQARGLMDCTAESVARQSTGARGALALVEAFEAGDELAYLRRAERLALHAVSAGVERERLRWIRVLFALERHRRHLAQRGEWLLPAACALFDQDIASEEPDGDGDGLAAAALLGARTGRIAYWVHYDQLCARWQEAAAPARARLFSVYAQALDVIDSAP